MNNFFSKYNYIFFDFDGVIVDSVDIKTRAFAKLFEDYGEEVVKKVVEYHVQHGGVSRYEKFRYYYKNFLNRDITEKEMEMLDKKFSEFVFYEVLKAPFIPGVLKFLNICYKNNKTMFIVSATPKEEIEKIVEGKSLSKFFKEITGSPSKKAENLAYLIKKYKISPLNSIYFGDAKSDLEAAAKNNVFFVPINYFDGVKGFKNLEEFMLHENIK